MRFGCVDWLFRQLMNDLRPVASYCVVRQVHVKVEGRNSVEPTFRIKITGYRQRSQLFSFWISLRTKAVTVLHWNPKPIDHRTCVLPKALLTRHQGIAVMALFNVTHFWIVRDPNFMVRTENQTGAFALQKILKSFNLCPRGLLPGDRVVQTKYQQRVGIG